MTKLYFIRHGKTQWNLEGRYQGSNGDSPLLETSYGEIRLLAEELRGIAFAHCYVSPLLRARLTAKLLIEGLGQDIPVTVCEGLREFNLGKMEGMTFARVKELFPKQLHAFRHAPAEYDPSAIDGESFQDLIKRMRPVVTNAVEADASGTENLLFISHGAALTALIQYLIGTPLADLRKQGGLTNSSITLLEADGPELPYHLLKWNDTHFLNKVMTENDTV